MSTTTIGLPAELQAYVRRLGVREPDVLRRLAVENEALPQRDMQIAPEQGALLALLVELIGARRCIELGTFTGYSSLWVALAMPADGRLLCCDISAEWTAVARRYWADAGVADRVELALGPALATLDRLIGEGQADTFDFAFVDAQKREYSDYFERLLVLIRPGGLIAFDNVFWGGDVVAESTTDRDALAVRALNERLAVDERVSIAMLPIADGVTLVRKR